MDIYIPFYASETGGELEVVRVLLEHGADVEVKDDKDDTAYHVALSNGYHDVANLLSEHGAK
jgi:ankyrin repeat protein